MTDFSEIWIDHFNIVSSRNSDRPVTIQTLISEYLQILGRQRASALFHRITSGNYISEYVTPQNCISRICRRSDRTKTQKICTSENRDRSFYHDLSCQIGYYYANELSERQYSAVGDILLFLFRVFTKLIFLENFIEANELYNQVAHMYSQMIRILAENEKGQFRLPTHDNYTRSVRIRNLFEDEYTDNRVRDLAIQQESQYIRQRLALTEHIGHSAPAAGGSLFSKKRYRKHRKRTFRHRGKSFSYDNV